MKSKILWLIWLSMLILFAPLNSSASTTTGDADLAIGKTASANSVKVGDQFSFELSVTNLGPDSATNVIVLDILPPGCTYVFSSGAGTYYPGYGLWILSAGAAGAVSSLAITVQATVAGTFTNTAFILGSNITDTNTANDLASAVVIITVTLPETPRLEIRYANGLVTICWSNLSTCFGLESAPSLSLPIAWRPVLDPTIISNGQRCLTLAATGAAQFYRLVSWPYFPATRLDIGAEEDGLGNDSFLLTWDEVPGATYYNLYFAAAPGVSKTNYSSLPQGTALTGITSLYAVVTNLTAGLRYYFVVTAISPCGESADSNEASGIFGPHGSVDGTIATELLFGTNVTQVPLSGVSVTLSNLTNSTLSTNVLTDADGSFDFPDQPAGAYQLCWSANGFISGCYSNTLIVSNNAISLDVILISPLTNGTTGLVYGKVTLQDGTPVLLQDSYLQVNVNPPVTLKDAGGHLLRSAPLNSSSQYLMAGVPRATSLFVGVVVENTGTVSNINTFNTGEADLVLPNTPPQLISLSAKLNGRGVYHVPPGAAVDVTAVAVDANADPLHYYWFPADNSSGFVSTDSSNVSWTLPATAGYQFMHVRISDGKGGYGLGQLTLNTDSHLAFSGFVVGSDGVVVTNTYYVTNNSVVTTNVIVETNLPPLVGAFASVNGAVTNTDANGFFSLIITNLSTNYVLNLLKSGYAPYTETSSDEANGRVYTLAALTPPDCTHIAFSDINVTNADFSEVHIPGNSLMYANGSPYTGPVCVSLTPVDPCGPSFASAGQNILTNVPGQESVLQAVAAAYLEVTDMSGTALFLVPGTTNASVLIPVGASCLASGSLPDSSLGVWERPGYSPNPADNWLPIVEEGFGPANLVTNGGLPFYEAPIAPLPLPVAPVAKGVVIAVGDAVQPKKLSIEVGPTLPLPLDILVHEDAGDGKKITLLNEKAEVVVIGGKTENVVVKVINPRESQGIFYFADQKVESDKEKTFILKYKQPVTNAETALKLDLTKGLAFIKTPDFTGVGNNNFLVRRSANTGTKDLAVDYYKLIGVANPEAYTFDMWKQENGWPANKKPGEDDEVNTVYFNANELGSGRWMHMKRVADPKAPKGQRVAFYVGTYKTMADASKASQGQALDHTMYTVAMTYKSDPTFPNFYTHFYAFDSDAAGGKLILDKPVQEGRPDGRWHPNLCIVCHGRGPAFTTGDAAAAHQGDFLPFDLAGFTFQTDSRAAQLPAFKTMNEAVLQTIVDRDKPGLAALTTALINGNGLSVGTTDVEKAYNMSCRACHVDERTNARGTSSMPHSQRTWASFWGSATAAALKAEQPAPYSKGSPSALNQPAAAGIAVQTGPP